MSEIKQKRMSMLARSDFGQDYVLPEINYESGRWSTTRVENVDSLSEHWEEAPNTVRFLEDPKLAEKRSSMVLMKKDLFEDVLTPLLKLLDGSAAIELDITLVKKNILALRKNMSFVLKEIREKPELEKYADLMDGAVASVEAIEITVTQLESVSLLMKNSIKPSSPTLNEEELELVSEALKDENDEVNEEDLTNFISKLNA